MKRGIDELMEKVANHPRQENEADWRMIDELQYGIWYYRRQARSANAMRVRMLVHAAEKLKGTPMDSNVPR